MDVLSPPDILSELSNLDHDPYWLARYLDFLLSTAEPDEGQKHDNHHILPVALFPQYKSIRHNPWNRIAHCYLCGALLQEPNVLYAFRAMSGKHFAQLIEDCQDESLLREIADEYERVRPGPWIKKDNRELRVADFQLQSYLDQGWEPGRTMRHSEDYKLKMSKLGIAQHAIERSSPNAYDYMPRGDQHHRRIYGISDETKAKISKTLMGHPTSNEAREKRRVSMIGKTWHWCLAARQAKSVAMQGAGNNRYGLPGYWAGKTRPEETKAKMSMAHLSNFQDPEFKAKVDAARPRGESHVWYGKPRDEATRTKIAASLTGIKQSDETKAKRALAMSLRRMPEWTPTELSAFYKMIEADPEERKGLIKSVKGSARELLQGLVMVLDGTAEEKNKRYWRMARTWLDHKSGLTLS